MLVAGVWRSARAHAARGVTDFLIAALFVLGASHSAAAHQSSSDSDAWPSAPTWSRYVICFFSGVLLTNFLAHFSHGISGEQFPAPLGFALGSGLAEHLSNVVWGFLNLVLGYVLFRRGGVAASGTRVTAFFAGVLAMGIFLAIVFSH